MVLLHLHDLPVYRMDPGRAEDELQKAVDRAVAAARLPGGDSPDESWSVRSATT